MKILGIFWYYKPANIYGGPTSAMATMCEELVSDGVDVTVFTTNANGKQRLNVPLNIPVDVNKVKVIYYPVSCDLFSINYSQELTKAIFAQINDFDMVISGLLWHPFLVDIIRTICTKAKVPYVVLLFGQLMPWALKQKNIKKQLFLSLFGRRYLNHASALQCTSSDEVNSVKLVDVSTPIVLIPHSINKNKSSYSVEYGLLRTKLGINKTDIVLLFLGRLHHVKRPELALEVLIKLCRPDVHLVYAGPDEERYVDNLQYISQQNGYVNQVHFVGNLNNRDVQQAFLDSDLLIMPSEQENFGMSAAEALMSEVPILTSKYVPVGVQAAEIGAGRIAELSVESFTYELKDLLKYPEKLKGMGKRGKEFAEQNYGESNIKRQIAIYTDIVCNKKKIL